MSSGIFEDGLFSIYANSGHSKYQILDIVKRISKDELSKEKLVEVLKEAKIDVEITINEVKEENFLQYHISQLPDICEDCKKRAVSFNKYCGAKVCGECGKHQGLARCYCGWNLQAGEKLPDDIGNAKYLGEGEWEVDY